MKASRKQFIKDGHAAACSEWKTKIEKEFPKLFKETKLFVGKWYKRQIDNGLWFLTKIEMDCAFGYGFDMDRDWVDISREYNYDTDLIPATDKEVEEALIKEAKKRGFKKGVEFIDVFDGKLEVADGNRFELSHTGRLLYNCDRIFSKGKWATIIDTISKEEAEKELGKTIID